MLKKDSRFEVLGGFEIWHEDLNHLPEWFEIWGKDSIWDLPTDDNYCKVFKLFNKVVIITAHQTQSTITAVFVS